jgi:hypothetical protein
MTGPDTRDAESLAGAVYFIVGRGTEGGPASYRLSVAGLNDRNWGELGSVAANSGYSIGTIQVDLGQRGTWGLGDTKGPASPGQTTYVDGLIDQSAGYAHANRLPFATDLTQLRSNLLSHGNGEHGRTSIAFIDADTRDSINHWASSNDGKKWIHANIDYPQVKSATKTATDLLDRYGTNVVDDRRLETVALLAKTANQWPSQLPKFKEVLEHGGTYEDVLATAQQIKIHNRVYDGLDAVAVAERYKAAFEDTSKAPALERAQAKVVREGFDPSSQATDSDIREALHAIGQGGRATAMTASDSLRRGSQGNRVTELQSQLVALNITDAHGRPLSPDGNFGHATQAAVEKFQAAHGMTVDGIVGHRTETALQQDVEKSRQATLLSLADERHPGVSLYRQALGGVRTVDEERGRSSDQASCHLAGSLAVAACGAGLNRIDHVAMSDDGVRAYAIQGDLNSPFKRYTEVNVAHSVTIPLEQSGADFVRAAGEQALQAPVVQPQQQTQQQEVPAQQPAMHR